MKVSKIEDIEERLIKFTVREVEYKIEWYKNVSTLWIGNALVRFTEVELRGTWPNSSKSNLQFYQNGEIVSVIGVEIIPK